MWPTFAAQPTGGDRKDSAQRYKGLLFVSYIMHATSGVPHNQIEVTQCGRAQPTGGDSKDTAQRCGILCFVIKTSQYARCVWRYT
jgi:hypothetical protein